MFSSSRFDTLRGGKLLAAALYDCEMSNTDRLLVPVVDDNSALLAGRLVAAAAVVDNDDDGLMSLELPTFFDLWILFRIGLLGCSFGVRILS